MKRHQWILLLFLSLMAGCFAYMGYGIVRSDTTLLISLYVAAFALFGLSYSLLSYSGDYKLPLVASILFRVLLLFFIPNLSDDFYRYFWDGSMINMGVNPYAYTPEQFIQQGFIYPYMEIYEQMNSQPYYSVYPSTSQFIFFISAKLFPTNIYGAVIVMKIFILLFEIGSIFLISSLLRHYELPIKQVFLYALNPLVIVELSGNVHFEAGMIFFCLLAIWLIVTRKKWFLSAIALALGIGTKLWPLVFVPIFLRPVGLKRFVGFGITLCIALALMVWPFYFDAIQDNIGESLQHYFTKFQFNGSIYYWADHYYLEVLKLGYWEKLEKLNELKDIMAKVFVAVFALYAIKRFKVHLPTGMLWLLAIYLFFASTVHPWYLTPLMAFGALTTFRFPIIWAVLITGTYTTYRTTAYEESIDYLVFEYVVLYGFIAYELFIRESGLLGRFARWQYLLRGKIKIERLNALLQAGETILDIGTGNGSVTKMLRQEGHTVTTVDVIDKSSFEVVLPVVYNGTELPFRDNQFSTALILTVLHHADDPEAVIAEAKRTSERIIIIEDLYTDAFQKYLTYLVDSIVNWEFWGHPHNNKTDKGWKGSFEKLGLQITKEDEAPFLLFFRQKTYVLEPA